MLKTEKYCDNYKLNLTLLPVKGGILNILMTQLELAKETVCSSLLNSVTKCEEIMQKTDDTQELLKLRKTQKNYLFRLELLCR